MFASSAGHAEIVDILLQHGANVDLHKVCSCTLINRGLIIVKTVMGSTIII